MKPTRSSSPPTASKWFKPAMIGLALVLFAGVSAVQKRLNHQRESMGLTRIAPLQNMPPVLSFTTVALGGFRGLIANVLWVRLADLQEQDKYFEMVQLADWISKLQPHFPTVWVHLAWNMSYNISVKFNDHNDRWLWVQRGVKLLRDDGLRFNPREPLIYRELAWHFQHKMGQNLDDAHNLYKAKWVEEMSKVFGTGQLNWDELLNPQTEQAAERVRLLKEVYKMDPAMIQKVDAEYGPLEWRLPESHAIYWAMVGLEKSDELKKDDFLMLRRAIFQSMQLAFHRGRLVFYPTSDGRDFIYAPNIEIVARTNKAYEEMIEQEPEKKDHLGTAHKNFLKTAVYFLYSYNRLTQANEWFAYMKENYPQSVPPEQSLDEFALAKVTEDVGETSHDRVKAILEGLIQNAFIHLALGEDDLAVSYERFAFRIRERFMNELGDKAQDRVGMPELSVMKGIILERLLDAEVGLEPQIQLQLRTKLGLPMESSPATNAPPSGLSSPSTNSVPAAAAKTP